MSSNIGRSDASPPTRWWWVRHAPVVVNDGRCYGQSDLPCRTDDATGFRGLAARLPREAVWVVSNLMRTHQTAAAIVAAGLPGPEPIPGPGVQVENGLAEQHFGEWQGQTYAALAERQAEDYHRFWFAPARERAPGGESFVDLIERVVPVIDRVNREHAGRDIIAVAHGGTIRAAIGYALGLSPEASLCFTIDNISLTRLDHFDDPTSRHGHSWRVAGLNQPAA
jgi:alpha-ribazole phosphatase